MYEDYKDVKATNYVLEAFFPFFIQAKQNGNLSFDNGSRILKAPTLFNATVPSREIDIDFTLTDPNGSSDNAGLTVGNDYPLPGLHRDGGAPRGAAPAAGGDEDSRRV